jgi:hypothetical protein
VAATVAALGAAAPASAGTYDVVSCGAPGANGVNAAWQVTPFDDRFWDVQPGCPEMFAWSERRTGVTVPNFTGAGFEFTAPPGAILDRMVIGRTGYRFNSTGTAQGPWSVAGYRADGSVIGGPLTGETCNFPSGRLDCRFGVETPRTPDTWIERDLETTKVLYSAACFDPPGCASANGAGYPFAGVSIYASIVTVREDVPPAVVARGALTEPGWHVDDAPLSLGASDPVGVRALRVLVDGAEVSALRPPCDYTRTVPCGQVPERAVRLGAGLPDGTHTVTVEATDTAGNVARADRAVSADRNAPALAFVPSKGRGRKVALDVTDAGSGTVSGTVAVRRGKRRPFRAVPAVLRGNRLVARLGRSRAGLTIRAAAVDAVGHRAELVGAPVRLRAGFGARLRGFARGGLASRPVVRGRLRAFGGRGLGGRRITVRQRLRVDGAAQAVAATAVTRRDGRFRVRLPAGGSRVLRVVSPGTGGLQAGISRLRYVVPWASTLRIAPRALAPGGRIALSGRLRLRGFSLPPSGARVELQAFDRGRWRVFATTRTRGARAAWHASYRFGTRSGSYRIRARIPRVGTVPFERGYSRPVTIRVG